jgi:Predicted membrane protein
MSKKKMVIIGGLIGGLLLIGAIVIGMLVFGGKRISEEEATQIALNHAKVTKEEAESLFVYLDSDDIERSYNVTFFAEGVKYEYDINARTGRIEDFDVEGVKNAVQETTPPANTETTQENAGTTQQNETQQETKPQETPAVTPEPASQPANQSANTSNATASITETEAKALVLAKVEGAVESDVWIKLDREDGRLVYEGKVIFNRMEYEFELDANNGTFYSWEVESVHD